MFWLGRVIISLIPADGKPSTVCYKIVDMMLHGYCAKPNTVCCSLNTLYQTVKLRHLALINKTYFC